MMVSRSKLSDAAQHVVEAALDRISDAYGSSKSAARSAGRVSGDFAREHYDQLREGVDVAADEAVQLARNSAQFARRHPVLTAAAAIGVGAAIAWLAKQSADKKRADDSASDEYEEEFG